LTLLAASAGQEEQGEEEEEEEEDEEEAGKGRKMGLRDGRERSGAMDIAADKGKYM
jgi:hypothetical protein